MKFFTAKFRKRLYFCSLFVLQIGSSGNAMAWLDTTGSITPTPNPVGNVWTAPNITIGSKTTNTLVTGFGSIDATSSLTIDPDLTNTNPYTTDVKIFGSGNYIRAEALTIGSGNALLAFDGGAALYTNTNFLNKGILTFRNAQWEASSDVEFLASFNISARTDRAQLDFSQGSVANVNGNLSATWSDLNIYQDSNFNINGDISLESANVNVSQNSTLRVTGNLSTYGTRIIINDSDFIFDTASGGGHLDLLHANLHIDNAGRNAFTTNSVIIRGTYGVTNFEKPNITLNNGSLWHNLGDFTLTETGPLFLKLTDSTLINDGDFILSRTNTVSNTTSVNLILDGSNLSSNNLIAEGLDKFSYLISAFNGSKVTITNDIITRDVNNNNWIVLSDSTLTAQRLILGEIQDSGGSLDLKDGSHAHFNIGIVGKDGGYGAIFLKGQSTLEFDTPLVLGDNGSGSLYYAIDSDFKAPRIDMNLSSNSSSGLFIQGGDTTYKGTFDVPLIQMGANIDNMIQFGHEIDSSDENGIKKSSRAYQFSPVVTGTATIQFAQGDTAILSDLSGYSGDMQVFWGGYVFITPQAILTSNANISLMYGGIINFDGGTQSVGDVYNDMGHISFGDGLAAVITMNSYTSPNISSMAMESGFMNQPGLTDKLIVLGDTSGTTYLRVRDVERTGADGDAGIEIIEVLGNSDGDFILMGDYTLPDGLQAVTHGAYAYTLHKGANDARSSAENNWYMRRVGGPNNGGGGSGGGGTGDGGEDIYQPAVSIYEAYPQALMELGRMPSLDEREGDRTYLGQGLSAGDAHSMVGSPSFWTALEGRHIKIASGQTKTRTSYKQNAIKMKAGIDVPVYEDAAGRLVVGASVHYTHGKTDTRGSHHYGEGDIKTKGFGVTPTVTWYGANGFYADGQAMITMYESDMKADKINFPLANENKSTGYAFSAEVGQKFKLQGNWGATLQGQLVYSGVNFDTFKDTKGAAVIEHDHGESLRARIGGKIDYTTANDSNRTSYYGGINLYNQFLKAPQVSVYDSFGMDPVAFKGVKEKAWIGIVGGMSHSWANDRYKLYGMVGASSPFSEFGDSYTARANVGLKVSF